MLSRDSKIINVGIAEIVAAKSPNILRTTLGSCIGVVLYQPDTKIGAISHIMLAKDTMPNSFFLTMYMPMEKWTAL